MRAPNLLSREACAALSERVLELVSADGAQVELFNLAYSRAKFARGDTHLAGQGAERTARLRVDLGGRQATVTTSRLDEVGLRALVAETEALAEANPTITDWMPRGPQTYSEGPQIAFPSTLDAMAAESQAALVQQTATAAEAARLVAAGEVAVETGIRSVRTTEGLFAYEHTTYGELSVTARNQEQRGSGWAWGGYEDWSRVDTAAVIQRAVELGRRSANPVAVEPGRYTVILEPTAVAALVESIIPWWESYYAYRNGSVFAGERRGSTKIGLQMMDRRLGLVASPWDSERPASTILRAPLQSMYAWQPITKPVVWFEAGILRRLQHDEHHAQRYGQPVLQDPGGLRLTTEGPSTSLDDMIASTKRGIWVSRLSNVATIYPRTLLLTGTTRDGTFLIENGKITKPIRNLRFTESPFFVLNKLEAWGEAVRASRDVVAPRLLLRDFNFTSLTDAI